MVIQINTLSFFLELALTYVCRPPEDRPRGSSSGERSFPRSSLLSSHLLLLGDKDVTSRNKRRGSKFEDGAEHSTESCASKQECKQHKCHRWYVLLKITGWKAVRKQPLFFPQHSRLYFTQQSSSAGGILINHGKKKIKKSIRVVLLDVSSPPGSRVLFQVAPRKSKHRVFLPSAELLENRFRHIFSTCSSSKG